MDSDRDYHENSGIVAVVRNDKRVNPIVLDHYIFDGTNGWRVAESRKQPSLKVRLTTDRADYLDLFFPV